MSFSQDLHIGTFQLLGEYFHFLSESFVYQYSFFRNPCILHFFLISHGLHTDDLLQFFYFVHSLNLPQSMTKHSFVVLRLSRYFLTHAQPQPYVLLQGYIICNPLQKRNISVLYVAKINEKSRAGARIYSQRTILKEEEI